MKGGVAHKGGFPSIPSYLRVKGANTRGSNLGKGLQSRSIQSHEYVKENFFFGGGYVVAYVL